MTLEYTQPQKRSGILSRDLGEELILYDRDQGSVCVLNITAGLIWRMCDGQNSAQDIADRLIEHHDVPGDASVTADVADMLSTLREMGLLQSSLG